MMNKFQPRLRNFCIGLALLSLAGCSEEGNSPSSTSVSDSLRNRIIESAENITGNFSSQRTLTFDSTRLDSFFSVFPLLASFKRDIRTFYDNRNFAYAWYDSSGLIEPAAVLYSRLKTLPEDGIVSAVPYLNTLDSIMATVITEPQQKIRSELLLSGLYFYFAGKVWDGLSQTESEKLEWFLPRKKIAYGQLLDSLLRTTKTLTGSEPVYRQYPLLKSYLKKYKQIDSAAKWQKITDTKKVFRYGDSGTVIEQIRSNLALTGDLDPSAATNNKYDSTLLQAVKSFQYRLGLKEDGVIGPGLIKEINIPVHHRIEAIMVNMERSRWLPTNVTGEYLVVNIPEFKLHCYDKDSLQWSMNVVVGRSVNKTVIFSGKLQYVVFSPYWNVPPGIYKNEVLPGIKKNKNYLAVHHMEKYGNGVRQLPGPWNSLGQVKFLFPNSYSIYLHDTPSKSLFGEDQRAFSHGCIRVAEPRKLAAYLLRNDSSWTDAKIAAAMKSGKEKYVSLKDGQTVFITYFTSFVDRQGRLNFRKDIYNRDSRIIEAALSDPQ